jgi:LuxR family maltose regulon positive regulatory protein
LVCYVRGLLELARGHHADALAGFRAAERMAGLLAAPHLLVRRVRALQLQAMVGLGETERAERALAELGEQERESGQIRIATAVLRLAQDHPRAALSALAPVLDGSAPVTRSTWLVLAFMLEAIARDALGDPAAVGRAVERALDLAEPDGTLSAFLVHPSPGLLERHARDCARHAALVAEILSVLPARPEGPPGHPGGTGGWIPPVRGGVLGGCPPG